MSFQVARNIELIRVVAVGASGVVEVWEDDDAYLSPVELAEQYREMEDAPGDDEYDRLYAYSVWDAVRGEWVEV